MSIWRYSNGDVPVFHVHWGGIRKMASRLQERTALIINKKAQLTQGLRATAVRVYRHLGFLKFQSCTINSAVPENPTLEPNSTSIGKPVAKLWPFLYIQVGRQPPSWILSNRK